MNKANRHCRILILLCLVVTAAGCGAFQNDQALSRGQYENIITATEARQSRVEGISFYDYSALCDAYSQTGNYAKLFACADYYVARSVDRGSFSVNCMSLSNAWRAKALLETGKYAEALELVDKSLRARAELSWREANFNNYVTARLHTLRGLLLAALKDEAGAQQSIHDLQVMSCGFGGAAPCWEERDAGIVRILLSLGRFQEAGEALAKGNSASFVVAAASVITLGSVSWDRYDQPKIFLHSKINYETGKTAEAKAGYLALLNNPATRSSGTIWWNTNFDLGRIARAEGDGKLAVERFTEAVATIESQRANINTEAAKIGFIGDKQAVYRELVSLLVEQNRAPEALEYVERAKSRALVDLLAERQNLVAQTQEGQASTAESLKLLASLEQKAVVYTGKGEEKERLRSAITGTQADLKSKAPELASLVTVTTAKATEIQAQLGADETLLEFYGQGDDLYAFTVTSAAITARKLDGQGLEVEVRALREALSNVGTDAWKPLARKLHARLVAPVPDALAKPKLIIVAHGALHYLPFNTLYDGKGFLIDRVTLQQLPSASVMHFLASRKPTRAKDLLLLGNPDLGDKAMDLPGAEAEARAIKGIWPNSSMLMRKAATKGALTKAGQLFRVIHVAAHGEFVSDQPLNSRLMLAPEGGDNGQLTAGDLYSLRLNADLVTLSACETGMGKVLSGDDVVGLTRGFLYAGANSIVASLWPVSDDETKFLMTSFYGNLKKMPKADALRQAQLDTKKKYPHPFYWSAFQLTGMGR